MDRVAADSPQPDPEKDESTTRRTFLSYVVAAISSFMGILVGVPIIGYVTSPLQSKEKRGEWVTLGNVDEFNQQQAPQMVNLTITRQDGWVQVEEGRTCWVVLEDGGSLTVFNGRCTHLGCAYSWQTQGQYSDEFHCPCHDGVFDKEGDVLDGPPPRPLDTLETKIENGTLQVFYQDFRLGVPNKKPL